MKNQTPELDCLSAVPNKQILHNRVEHRLLKAQKAQDDTPRTTISFYQYFVIEDPNAMRDSWYARCLALGVLGRIYIAKEGVNAQISVPSAQLESFRAFLHETPALCDIRLNYAIEDHKDSFYLLKIKVRPQIVADGITDETFDLNNRGMYLEAAEMNALMDAPDTVVVDMRNHYEYEVGHFEQAIEIPADTFKEQLPMAVTQLQAYQDKTIIMYCTGGIRCEKASAYFKHHGFKKVYHLKGGIIHYTQQVRAQGLKNRFRGKNFVFDERQSEHISHDVIAHCHQCGALCDTHVNCAQIDCHVLFIQCAACAEKFASCCSETCKALVEMPREAQQAWRRTHGVVRGFNIFNKSRSSLPYQNKSPR